MTIDLGSVPQAGTSSGGMSSGGAPPQPKTCDDSCTAIGKCEDAKCVIEENPGQLTPDQQQLLRGGGSSDAQFTWLYPYDATVFPRGLRPPLLQLGGGAADAFYVHISFGGLDYQGFFAASDPARVQLSDSVWQAITRAASGTDSVKVEVSKLQGSTVTGPITETWTVAQGSLRGALYYDAVIGIYRLKPGDESADLLAADGGGVTVSADGSTLVASTDVGYRTYDLKANSSVVKEWQPRDQGGAGPVGLYPDGSLLMVFTPNGTAQLVDPRTAADQPQPGWPSMTRTAFGSFAPDGSKIAYFDHDTEITILDFARATTTFSNRKDFAVESTSGIPNFTPDTGSLIYVDGSSAERLGRIDIQSGQAFSLDAMNGREASNFASSVLPLSVGGYYWVVFTSDRAYGNTSERGEREVLWVAALDMSATSSDSSHPAIYLEGQDPTRLNRFSQWALEPCQGDGSACDFGDVCCGGYCRDVSGTKQCLSTPPNSCANELEHCDTPADCCDKTYKCINSRCAAPKPVVK